jgi:hypothetical protein
VEEAARSLLLFRCVEQNNLYTPCLNLFSFLLEEMSKFASSCWFLIFFVFSISFQGTVRILRALFELEKKIDLVPLSNNGPGDTPSNVLPGAWLCNLLEEIGLVHTMVITRCEPFTQHSTVQYNTQNVLFLHLL